MSLFSSSLTAFISAGSFLRLMSASLMVMFCPFPPEIIILSAELSSPAVSAETEWKLYALSVAEVEDEPIFTKSSGAALVFK